MSTNPSGTNIKVIFTEDGVNTDPQERNNRKSTRNLRIFALSISKKRTGIFVLSISTCHQPWASAHPPKRISQKSARDGEDAPTSRGPIDSRREWEEEA